MRTRFLAVILPPALFLAACTHAESPADAIVRLPAPPPDAPAAAGAPASRAPWVEAVTHESHDAADVEMTYLEVHAASARASETMSTHLHDWAMENAASIEGDAKDAEGEDVDTSDIPRFSLHVACDPKLLTESLVSIVCDVGSYTGGAHGNYVVEAFNFAIDGDEVRAIGMDDLFLDPKLGRSAVSDRCVAELRAQDAMWVTGGTVTDVTDMLDTFHFEKGQIVVHFAPYEVGPFAEGEHVVEVPFEVLRGVRPAWKNRFAELPSSRDSIEVP